MKKTYVFTNNSNEIVLLQMLILVQLKIPLKNLLVACPFLSIWYTDLMCVYL